MSLEPPPSAVDKFTNHWRQWFSRVFTYVKSIDLTGAITDNSTGTAITIRSDNDVEFTGGIYLGGTATANLLDDYEEGTFTAGLTFGGASTGITYGSQAGRYTKVGDSVSINLYITLTNNGTATGTANVAGLPFALRTGAGEPYVGASVWLNNVTNSGSIQGYGVRGTTTVALEYLPTTGAAVALNDTHFSNSAAVIAGLTISTAL